MSSMTRSSYSRRSCTAGGAGPRSAPGRRRRPAPAGRRPRSSRPGPGSGAAGCARTPVSVAARSAISRVLSQAPGNCRRGTGRASAPPVSPRAEPPWNLKRPGSDIWAPVWMQSSTSRGTLPPPRGCSGSRSRREEGRRCGERWPAGRAAPAAAPPPRGPLPPRRSCPSRRGPVHRRGGHGGFEVARHPDVPFLAIDVGSQEPGHVAPQTAGSAHQPLVVLGEELPRPCAACSRSPPRKARLASLIRLWYPVSSMASRVM